MDEVRTNLKRCCLIAAGNRGRGKAGCNPLPRAPEVSLGGKEGKERKWRGLPVANGEGAIITVLITIDHRLLARALSEGGDRRREELWLEEEE